jgi:GGDEF domain-containing protein
MKNLKVPLIILFFFLLIVFNIENLPYGTSNLLPVHKFLDILITAIVIASLLFRVFRNLSIYANLAFWVIVYFGIWFLAGKSEAPQINLQIVLVEVTFVSLATVLSREVALNLFELEDTLDRLVFASFRGRTMNMNEASDGIKTEFQRSRRHQRPVTVMVIEPDASSIDKTLTLTVDEIQHNLAKRYALGKISEAINANARRPDLIIKAEHSDRFVLICPETTRAGSNNLIQRIRSAVQTQLGISLSIGIASFPEDALTFDDLLHKASAKLEKPSELPIPFSSEEDVNIHKP